MSLNIEVLKKMIENYDLNIKNFTRYVGIDEDAENRLYTMVTNRRLIAAMIENDGAPVTPTPWRNGNVFFDSMLYASCSGVEIY